ncbi:MAG: DUF5678 domain-containing protein [Thermoproteota archaeon]|nr:DUF5678 domain-containing protein [Thermoproteota archaeon]
MLEQYKENLNWFNSNYNFLVHRYNNQYVAINNNKIIDFDRYLDKLIERLKANYRNIWFCFAIDFVFPENHLS